MTYDNSIRINIRHASNLHASASRRVCLHSSVRDGTEMSEPKQMAEEWKRSVPAIAQKT